MSGLQGGLGDSNRQRTWCSGNRCVNRSDWYPAEQPCIVERPKQDRLELCSLGWGWILKVQVHVIPCFALFLRVPRSRYMQYRLPAKQRKDSRYLAQKTNTAVDKGILSLGEPGEDPTPSKGYSRRWRI